MKPTCLRILITLSLPILGGFVQPQAFAFTMPPAPAHALLDLAVTGTVSDERGAALPGVSIVVKGTSRGTTTNAEGAFRIDVPEPQSILVLSFIGYQKQEISVQGRTTLSIRLTENKQDLDEVVVTGVFDKRSRMESSVAISTLSSKQIDRITPLSAADLLKNIPGVYVNSSLGEIRNTVYSRGVSVGSNDGASGYYYVSLQEDGLPVTNATFGNYGPDFFLRADATLGRLEAVRGGTASILGNNAPGGIFNYLSKTGGSTFAGEVRAKYGLEGNGKNPFYRADVNLGGPLTTDKTLTYNIGGFLRQSDGARNPGYPMNNGGQIKANLVKQFKNGSVKLFTKYLDDHNAWFEFLPTVGFTDPHLPAGVEQTNSVLIPGVTSDFTINDTGVKKRYDSRDKVHSKDLSIGVNIDQSFGNGWTLDNKARYSAKSSVWNTTAVVYPFAVDGLVFYYTLGALGQFGTYTFKEQATGNPLASVMQLPNIVNGQFAGFNFNVNNSTLPGAAVQPNSLYFSPLFYTDNRMKEFIDQFTLTKRLKTMSFTAGGFYANSALDRQNGVAGVAFTTITAPHPQLTTIAYTDFAGQTSQLTSPAGILGGGNGSPSAISLNKISQNQLAFFFGHNWSISEKLNFDWGVRYESVGVRGTNQIATSTPSTTGGVDGNPLTEYDNNTAKITAVYDYDKTVKTLSFSGGLNYKFNENMALYGRYSKGEKAPDMDLYVNVNTAATQQFLDPIAQQVQQVELGLKAKTARGSFFITPFYSILSNVPIQQQGQVTADLSSIYTTPVLYNKYETKGIELEATYNLTRQLSVRAVATFQSSKAVIFQAWDLGENGRADDKIVSFSGNETDNNPRSILRLVPTYSAGKFYGSLEWSYLGKRAANVPNAFYLPGFHQTNLTLGFNATSKIQLTANVNNVFNQIGIMSWSAPGGFPAALNRQGFTKAQLETNPNAVYSSISIPPRAYFLAVSYKF